MCMEPLLRCFPVRCTHWQCQGVYAELALCDQSSALVVAPGSEQASAECKSEVGDLKRPLFENNFQTALCTA